MIDSNERITLSGKRSKKLVLDFGGFSGVILPDHHRKNFLDEQRTRIRHLGRYRRDVRSLGQTDAIDGSRHVSSPGYHIFSKERDQRKAKVKKL